jgi:hypothetical protein
MENSKSDRQMKFQGSFTCESVSAEKNGGDTTLAEKDVSRVRCAKDEWKITPGRLIYTRTLFMSPHCETLLGKFTFQSSYTNDGLKLKTERPECKVVRVSGSWLAENSGKCMLKNLELDKPYSLHSNYSCENYVPAFCHSSAKEIEIEAVRSSLKGPHDPYDVLDFTIQPSGKRITCKRYAAE